MVLDLCVLIKIIISLNFFTWSAIELYLLAASISKNFNVRRNMWNLYNSGQYCVKWWDDLNFNKRWFIVLFHSHKVFRFVVLLVEKYFFLCAEGDFRVKWRMLNTYQGFSLHSVQICEIWDYDGQQVGGHLFCRLKPCLCHSFSIMSGGENI